MNRLLRSGGAGRLLARRNQEVRGGGRSALGPVLLVVGGVGAYWVYNNRNDVKKEAQYSFKKLKTDAQEKREDWEKYLPISAKHRKSKETEKVSETVTEVEKSPEISEKSVSDETVLVEDTPPSDDTAVLEQPDTVEETVSEPVENILSDPAEISESSENPVENIVPEPVVEETVPELPIEETVPETPVEEKIPEPIVEEIRNESVIEEVLIESSTPESSGESSEIAVQTEPVEIVAATETVDIPGLVSVAEEALALAVESFEKAEAAVSQYISAKKVALGVSGDSDTRAAFWLHVTEAERNLHNISAELGVKSKSAEEAINALSDAGIEPNVVQEFKSALEGGQDKFSAANQQLEILADLESELEQELNAKKEKFLASLPDSSFDQDILEIPKFTDEDLKGLIFIAQRKLETVARELKELKTVQKEEVEKALNSQREELLIRAENEIAELKAAQEVLIETKRAEIKEELRDEFEEDLKLQLKRQSAAHAAHLTEELAQLRQAQEQKAKAELDSQITSLSTQYLDDISQERDNMTKALEEEQKKYLEILQQLLGYANGIEVSLSEREKTEMGVARLQCMLLAVESMQEAVLGVANVPLTPIAESFHLLCAEDEAIRAIVSSLPDEAKEKGVLSPKVLEASLPALLETSQCQFMVNDEGNGLFARLRSAVNSRFSTWNAPAPIKEVQDISGDFNQIQSAARFYLREGDLENCTRVLNQLTGEPRRIVDDWIHEARLSLEVQQALKAIVAISEARVLSARSYS